jgi:hypothetical protein
MLALSTTSVTVRHADDSVGSNGKVASTLTVSVAEPTFNASSTVLMLAVSTTILFSACVSKPSFSTLSS